MPAENAPMSPTMQLAVEMLVKQCYEASRDRGFWEDYKEAHGADVVAHTITKLALITTEVAEAIEAVRKDPHAPDEHCAAFTSEEIELADILIRVCDYAGGRGLRLSGATAAKLHYNYSRAHMHGKRA